MSGAWTEERRRQQAERCRNNAALRAAAKRPETIAKKKAALAAHNKKLWTPERRQQQSERIRAFNASRKDSPETIAKRKAGQKVWFSSPEGSELKKKHGERMRALNASPEESRRRSELMKRRHAEGTTGLPKPGGKKRIVNPVVKKPKRKVNMSPEARARASEHMKRVNREVLTPERRAEMGRKTSATIRSRPYVEVEHLDGPGGPNKMEATLMEVIAPLGFRFVGDGRFWIGPCKSRKCRNPDFLFGSGKNKAALLFHGRYWHQRADADDKEELDDYTSAGWRVLVIWENELKDREALLVKASAWLASLGFETLAA